MTTALQPDVPNPLSGDDDAEKRRLADVRRLDVLDTPREEAFDRITRLARKVFQVPIAMVTIIDDHRSWFKSCYGLAANEAPRQDSFCNQTIRQKLPLVVHDASSDPRFEDNPFVLAEKGIRFYAGIPLETRDGNSIGTLCVLDTQPRQFDGEQVSLLSDLARMVMDELELRVMATIDNLTGALSRRAFNQQSSRTVALALRHHHEVSCIVWDLDHFKSINDSFGHASGDHVLTSTVKACRSSLRATDYIGRMGGEEFAVLLPNTPLSGALEVAEKLRTAIAQLKFGFREQEVSVSASFGVVSLGASHKDLKALLGHADEALYAAKSAGRNRCMAWNEPSTGAPATPA